MTLANPEVCFGKNIAFQGSHCFLTWATGSVLLHENKDITILRVEWLVPFGRPARWNHFNYVFFHLSIISPFCLLSRKISSEFLSNREFNVSLELTCCNLPLDLKTPSKNGFPACISRNIERFFRKTWPKFAQQGCRYDKYVLKN